MAESFKEKIVNKVKGGVLTFLFPHIPNDLHVRDLQRFKTSFGVALHFLLHSVLHMAQQTLSSALLQGKSLYSLGMCTYAINAKQ